MTPLRLAQAVGAVGLCFTFFKPSLEVRRSDSCWLVCLYLSFLPGAFGKAFFLKRLHL